MLDEGDPAGVPLLAPAPAPAPAKPILLASALAIIQLINAGYTVMSKEVMNSNGMSPLIFSSICVALAFPVMLCMALAVDGVRAPEAGDMPRIAALGMFGMFGNQILFLWGLHHTSSTVAAVINQSQPLFTATLAVALGLEEASLAKGVGVVLAAGGAVVVVGPGTLEHPGSEATGILMVAGSALCMACYFIVQKPALRKYPPLTITAWAYGAGTVLMGGTVWAAGALGEGAWEPTSATWLALAFAVALNSVAKYSLQSYAIAEVEASTLTVSGTAAPVLTAGLAKAFLAEPLRWRYLGGGAAVALGIGLVAAAGSARRRRAGVSAGAGAVGSLDSMPIPGSPLPAGDGGGHVGSWGRIIGDDDGGGWLAGWASPSTRGGSWRGGSGEAGALTGERGESRPPPHRGPKPSGSSSVGDVEDVTQLGEDMSPT